MGQKSSGSQFLGTYTAAERISASTNACACVGECKFVEPGLKGKLFASEVTDAIEVK